jgi:hypothetical protein
MSTMTSAKLIDTRKTEFVRMFLVFLDNSGKRRPAEFPPKTWSHEQVKTKEWPSDWDRNGTIIKINLLLVSPVLLDLTRRFKRISLQERNKKNEGWCFYNVIMSTYTHVQPAAADVH